MNSPSSEITTTQASITGTPRLRQALDVCLLLMVAATALAHPLCLSSEILSDLYQRLKGTPLFGPLLPWVSCGYTPLVVKESVFLTVTAALLFTFSWLKIRGMWLGTERSALADAGSHWCSWLHKPEVWAMALCVYFAISIAWCPVFQQSLTTIVLATSGIAVLLVVRSAIARPAFAVKFMVLTMLCGAVIATFALLQHLDRMPFLPRADDPRNRMSSLIGHNTGMSAWLMFPLSFSIYFLITNRRLWARAAAAVLSVLFVLVIIAAQSRAIWVLAAVICMVVPWQVFRLFKKRIALKWILSGIAVLLALVLGLSLSPQINPLARLPVSLEERVTDHILNLDQLRRETRLRILVVSLAELFPKAPLFGTGLGSFAWEYPKAQGEYFTANPDTWLGTTARRTDLAHNDYLQVLVETGLVGLALLLGGIYALGRESWATYHRLASARDRALWWSLAAPVTAVAAHALVDFPLHVAPIALITLVSLALITRLAPASALNEFPTQAAVTASPGAGRRATVASLLMTTLIFAWLPWGWQALVGRVMVSDSYYNGGLNWLDDYRAAHGQTVQRRLALIDRASRSFREAVINNVFNGEAYQGQATALINRSALLLHELETVKATGQSTTGTEPLRSMILNDSRTAIVVTENQLQAGGLRYHYTYYVLGRAWRMQWELEKDTVAPEDSTAYQNAVAALRQALEFNPADSMSIRELSDLLSESQRTVNESQELQSLLFKLDPWAADDLLLQPAIKLASEGEIPTARTMLEPIVAQYPRHVRVMMAQAWLAFYEAVWPPAHLDNIEREAAYLQWRKEKLAPARPILTKIPDSRLFRAQKERLQLLYAGAEGDLKMANQLSKSMLERDMWNREARAVYYWTQHELFGETLQYEHSVEYYRTRGLLAIYFMPPRKTGLSLAELANRAGLPDELKVTLPEIYRVIAFCEANDWWEFMSLFMPGLLNQYPGDEKIKRSAAEMNQRLLAAKPSSPDV